MGPIDEVKQTFAMDCYFRQFWFDDRLRYNNTRSACDVSLRLSPKSN